MKDLFEKKEMRILFKKQIDENILISEDVLKKIQNKNYYNNEPIKIGDCVLYGILQGEMIDDVVDIKIITLNESQFDLYEDYGIVNNIDKYNYLPVIKLKNK